MVDPTLPPDPPDQVLLLRGQGSTPRICCVEGNWAAHTLTLGFPSWRLDTALEQATGQNEWERQMSQDILICEILKKKKKILIYKTNRFLDIESELMVTKGERCREGIN